MVYNVVIKGLINNNMEKEKKDYFINCKDENIISFANALLYETGDEQSADETAKDVVARIGGDTSIEQVWENRNYVAMLSTDTNVTVLNIVHKRDERDMESVDVA